MRAAHQFIAFAALFACVQCVTETDGVALDNEAVPVVSASDFLKRLRKQPEANAREESGAAIKPRLTRSRSIDRNRVRAEMKVQAVQSATMSRQRKQLRRLRKTNAMSAHKLTRERSSEMLRLGESMEDSGQLSPMKLSAAEQARLNLETSEAFPDDQKRMSILKKRFPHAVGHVAELERLHSKNLKRREHYQHVMENMEDESEYDIMTNPDVAKADAEAQSKLSGLRQAEMKLAKKLSNAKMHAKHLARQVLRAEKLHTISEKAVLLMKNYKSELLTKLRDDQSRFRDHTLAAAEKTAKKQYHSYLQDAERKLQQDTQNQNERKRMRKLARAKRAKDRKERREARRKRREARRALRRKRAALSRAARLAEEDARVKARAEEMFKEYTARFRETERQQSEFTHESHADLGESVSQDSHSDLGESASIDDHKNSESKDSNKHGLSATLDKLQAVLKSSPKKAHSDLKSKEPKSKEPKQPAAFGLDSN